MSAKEKTSKNTWREARVGFLQEATLELVGKGAWGGQFGNKVTLQGRSTVGGH